MYFWQVDANGTILVPAHQVQWGQTTQVYQIGMPNVYLVGGVPRYMKTQVGLLCVCECVFIIHACGWCTLTLIVMCILYICHFPLQRHSFHCTGMGPQRRVVVSTQGVCVYVCDVIFLMSYTIHICTHTHNVIYYPLPTTQVRPNGNVVVRNGNGNRTVYHNNNNMHAQHVSVQQRGMFRGPTVRTTGINNNGMCVCLCANDRVSVWACLGM
jgi:hypothetical protein